MIDDSELLAGLVFLERHVHDDYKPALQYAISTVNEIRFRRSLDVLRARPAGDLEISIRAHNAIKTIGLKTIGAVEYLMSHPDSFVLSTHRCLGKKTVKELRLTLKELGLEGEPKETNA